MKNSGLTGIESAVLVPLLQSTITGGLFGIVAGGVAALTDASQPAIVGVTTGAVVTLAAWMAHQANYSRRLDAAAGIQQGMAVKAAESRTIPVKLAISTLDGTQGAFMSLPGGQEKLIEFAKGLAEGLPLTTRQWTGRSGLYAPGEYDQLRGELIKRGFAAWKSSKDTRGGVELTRPGKALFKYLANIDALPYRVGNLEIIPKSL